MIYYLDVHGRGSWADCFLQGMCYNCAPGRLQAAIKRVFELATSRISIEGTEVVAFPLFEVSEQVRMWGPASRYCVACRSRLGRDALFTHSPLTLRGK